MAQPSIFVSYSHADKPLAHALAAELERCGVGVWIDERELRVGDSIIKRVATAVVETDFFLALVSEASRESAWCQKELHLAITGELGSEGVQVLPLRVGGVEMPATLKDVFYLDVDPDDLGPAVERLVRDVTRHAEERHGDEASAPPPSPASRRIVATTTDADATAAQARASSETTPEPDAFEPIRITGVVREGIGEPANDDSPGSSLYSVPLRLSRQPSELWSQTFQQYWDDWPYAHKHEVHVQGDTIVFPRTDMEELEQSHLPHLRLVLERVNREVEELERDARIRAQRDAEERAAMKRAHDESVERIADRLKFD